MHEADEGRPAPVRPTSTAKIDYAWYPVNEHPSDEALHGLAVPPGWMAAASGTPGAVEGNTQQCGWKSGSGMLKELNDAWLDSPTTPA